MRTRQAAASWKRTPTPPRQHPDSHLEPSELGEAHFCSVQDTRGICDCSPDGLREPCILARDSRVLICGVGDWTPRRFHFSLLALKFHDSLNQIKDPNGLLCFGKTLSRVIIPGEKLGEIHISCK